MDKYLKNNILKFQIILDSISLKRESIKTQNHHGKDSEILLRIPFKFIPIWLSFFEE